MLWAWRISRVHAREQALLLPASVEDYVSADNPVRFIDAFVEDLDLVEAGFLRTRPKATGRPGYAPGDMLKLYLYGYLSRVRSSRRLEADPLWKNGDLLSACACPKAVFLISTTSRRLRSGWLERGQVAGSGMAGLRAQTRRSVVRSARIC